MKETLELLWLLAQVIGIPVAIAAFIWDRMNAQREREDNCYREVGGLFDSFVRLGIERPQLGLFGHEEGMPYPKNDEERREKTHAMELLLSMLESIHFHYHRGIRTQFRNRQWHAWEGYMRDWARNRFFREYWEECWDGERMDADFRAYLRRIIAEESPDSATAQPAQSANSKRPQGNEPGT